MRPQGRHGGSAAKDDRCGRDRHGQPVYFYSIDAQLKAVIDRTVARWLEVKNKDFYYVVTMADEDVSSADTTLACLRGYAACVRGAQEKGVLIGSGVYEPGKVKDTPAMQQAYQMGKNV